jgi:hypothetical protein
MVTGGGACYSLPVRWWWLAAAVVLASSPASAQAPAQVIVMQERVPFAFLLGTPTGEVGRTSSSEIIRLVTDLARRNTDFDVQLLDTNLMGECRGRLGCLTLKARRDYQRSELLDDRGQPLPYREHVRRQREAGQVYPKYLLVVSNVTLSGQADRMSAVLVNTDLALTFLHETPRDAPDWEDAAEARINSGAVVAPPARAQVATPEETEAFLAGLFTAAFRPAFEATGNWAPYGTLDLATTLSGAAIFLDDKPLGPTQAGLTRIEKVPPGQHVLRGRAPRAAALHRGAADPAGRAHGGEPRAGPAARGPERPPSPDHAVVGGGAGGGGGGARGVRRHSPRGRAPDRVLRPPGQRVPGPEAIRDLRLRPPPRPTAPRRRSTRAGS